MNNSIVFDENNNLSYLGNINCCLQVWNIITSLFEKKSVNKKIIWWEDSIPTLINNLTLVSSIINNYKEWGKESLNKNDLFLLENLKNINEQAINTAKNIAKDLFKDFLGKNSKINKSKVFIETYWELPFLNENLYINNNLEVWEKILLNIYILSINYIISYYKWLNEWSKEFICNIDKWFDEEVQKITMNLWTTIDESHKNIKSKEQNAIRQILMLLWTKVDKEVFKQIVNNIEKWRVKSFESSVKKLLKSQKYREQFEKNWILWDQIWFLAKFEWIDELKDIAKQIHEEFKKWDNIDKFNDRWVITKSSTNSDTIEDMIPFVNIWIKSSSCALWEISLRYNEDNVINDIIEKYWKDKDIWKILKNLIIKIDDLNHDIYKLSQDIKIIREFINEWIINNDTYTDKKAREFIIKSISIISNNIINKIKEYLKNINEFKNINIDWSVELIVYEIFEEKLKWVIDDLTWENILENIKSTDSYKKSKDKKAYLERLKIKFEKKYKNIWKKNPISSYWKDIQDIYNKYEKAYKQALKRAVFYNNCKKLKEASKNKNRKILERKKELYDNLLSTIN